MTALRTSVRREGASIPFQLSLTGGTTGGKEKIIFEGDGDVRE